MSLSLSAVWKKKSCPKVKCGQSLSLSPAHPLLQSLAGEGEEMNLAGKKVEMFICHSTLILFSLSVQFDSFVSFQKLLFSLTMNDPSHF